MSNDVSGQTWAKIVYGRSYHLDFRFVTIPQDFTAPEIAWVSPYILTTTQKARNLANHPRWSLFKNDSHCVVGVTCMVRDLIGKLGEDLIEAMTKDDRGRPLYVFVGYVTRLNQSKCLLNVPAYTENYLVNFKSLYQEIEKVWLQRDYDNRKPYLSEYKSLNKTIKIAAAKSNVEQITQLNNQEKSPHQTFFWQQSTWQNSQLWLEAAQSQESTSICLNIKGKSLVDSPFLNQTVTNIKKFTVKKRILNTIEDTSHLSLSEINSNGVLSSALTVNSNSASLKEKISTRAKEDLDITIKQAAKVTSASQEVITNLTNWSNPHKKAKQSNSSLAKSDSFGFKHKNNTSNSPKQEKQDWF